MNYNKSNKKYSIFRTISIFFPVVLLVCIILIAAIFFVLPAIEENFIIMRRNELKNILNPIYNMLEHEYEMATKDPAIEERIKKDFAKLLGRLRYNKSDYYFILDTKGILISHPFLKDYINKSVYDFKDIKNKYFVKEIITNTKQNGEYFGDYYFRKLTGKNAIKKMVYCRLFEPWGWIVCDGAYYDDIYEYMNRITRKIKIIIFTVFSIVFIISLYVVFFNIKLDKERAFYEKVALERERELQIKKRLDSMGRLAGGIAHDINNILTAIFGYIGLIKRELSNNNSISKYIGLLDSELSRIRDMVNRLLLYKKDNIQFELVDINVLIKDVVELNKNLFEKKGIAVSLKLEANNNIIMADPLEIRSIVLNLIVNACDALPEHGGIINIGTKDIEISLDKDNIDKDLKPGKYVMLFVKDNGSGIPDDILDKIFEPFFTTKKKDKGIGLGLSTVYTAVKNNNGFIGVSSELNKGTEFRVYFPICSIDNKERVEGILQKKNNNNSVLIIDDEEGILFVFKEFFVSKGYRVLIANNAEEGVKLYNENANNISLLFVDVVMSDMNGMEFLEAINLDNIKDVYIMSGYTKDIAIKDFINNKNIHFLKKPFDFKRLEEIIKNKNT